jgi:hypothetical protein
MLKFLSIIWLISSVKSAPTKSEQLLDIVVNDTRTSELQKLTLVNECRLDQNFSKSLCYAMFDIALAFNSRHLEFTLVDMPGDSAKFCEALTRVVPDEPLNDDSSIAFKEKAQWFKDVLKKDDSCQNSCFILDRITYKRQLMPVCSFIFQQYSFLSIASPPTISTSQNVGEVKRELLSKH